MKVMVKDLSGKIGQEITEFFVLKEFSHNQNAKTAWVNARLADSSGQVSATIFKECFEKADLNGLIDKVIKVRGLVNLYEGKARIQIREVVPAKEGEYEIADFVSGLTSEQIETLSERLMSLIDTVQEPKFKGLLQTVFCPKGVEFYRSLPGGHKHHVYNGGLLVHTIEVAEISDLLCAQDDASAQYHLYQKPVNRDLCITGALLHDVGKTKEFIPYPLNARTEQGYYVGYQTEGAGIVDRNIKRLCTANPGLDFGEYRQELLNMVLSCHTNYRMSMPPRTKEARFVLLADEASAYRDAYDTAVALYKQQFPDSEDTMIYSEYFKCNIKI